MQNGNNAYGSVNYTGRSNYSYSNYAIPSGGNLSVIGSSGNGVITSANYSYIYASLSPSVMPSFTIESGSILQEMHSITALSSQDI